MTNKLISLLEPHAVQLHLDVKNATEAITQLGNLLFQAGYVEDSFVQAALDREKQLPTGLPLGGSVNAAIPHTDVVHVKRAGLAMATLDQPVVFRNMVSPDEQVPVQLMFVMALDEPKAQVEMLQEIATVLQNNEIVERLMQANTYEDVKMILS